MVFRVGGLASGMDTEAMVKKLMEAERIPLTKMQQEKTMLTWKTEAYRDINSKLLDMDQKVFDMKLSTSYKTKSTTSSQENAVTATASSSSTIGSYNINVEQLAASDVYSAKVQKDENGDIESFSFKMKDEVITIENEEDLKNISKTVKDATDGSARAFYDETSGKIVIESTKTGADNALDITSASNITFNQDREAKDAVFKYNGVEFTSETNSYSLNGINFEFHNTTVGDAQISVSNDVEDAFDKIKEFVEKYNEIIDEMNASQMEKKYRDYQPLTEEQKAEMTDKQIEQWEEKSKSGVLRGESSIRNGMSSLRASLQGVVDTDGEFNMLSQIGITTTKNYLDGGKLEIDEDKLKAALRDNADDVFKLFSSSEEGEKSGLMNRFDDALDQVRGQIDKKAGSNASVSLENYSIGKQVKDLNTRIGDFEQRMTKVETRYWNQFNAMEKAISQLNQQADYLFSQMDG